RSGSTWLKHPALARLRAVEFGYGGAHPRGKAIRDCLKRLRPLDHFGVLGGRLEEADALAILADPVVAGVRSLWIGGTPLSIEAEAAFRSAAWPNLRRLT